MSVSAEASRQVFHFHFAEPMLFFSWFLVAHFFFLGAFYLTSAQSFGSRDHSSSSIGGKD